jgi:hypothetical protein
MQIQAARAGPTSAAAIDKTAGRLLACSALGQAAANPK